MDQQEIAANIARMRDYLRTVPEMARFRDIPARATVERDLVIRVTGPGGLPDGMLAGIGDSAGVPSPGWFFRASLASSVALFIVMRAAEKGANLDGLEVVVEAESDDRGALGMSDEIPPGPLQMHIIIRYASSDLDEEATREVVEWAVQHSTVQDAVTRAVPLTVSIERSTPAGDPAAAVRA